MKLPAEFSTEDRLAAGFIGKMKAGDTAGLSGLYRLYQRPLFAFIRAIVREEGGSEEVLQDVFVRVHEQAGRYDPELGTPFVWVATIARRMSIDWIRRNRRHRHFVRHEGEQAAQSVDHQEQGNGHGIYQQLDEQRVLESFEELPPDQAKALELAFMEGFTHQEIAHRLGKPLGTVKSDLRRGLERLRKIFMGEG